MPIVISNIEIAANAPTGTTVGVLTAIDSEDNVVECNFITTKRTAGYFGVSGDNLVTLWSGLITPGYYSVRVHANGITTQFPATANFTILVTAANTSPPTPTRITFSPTTASLVDNSVAGTTVAALSVSMSDGSSFSGTMTASPADVVAVSGDALLVLARGLSPADDGLQQWTVNAIENGVTTSGSIQVQVTAAVSAPPPSPPPPMTTIVQYGHSSLTFSGTSSTSGSAAYGSNVTSGNYLIVGFCTREGTVSTPVGSYTVGITDTLSSTWFLAADFGYQGSEGRNHLGWIYAAKAGSSGANTVSITISGGSNFRGGGIFIYEVANLTSTTPESSGYWTSDSLTSAITENSTTNVTWTSSAPFLVSVCEYDVIATGLTPQKAGYSTQVDDTTNTHFGSLYAVGSVANGFSSPDTFTLECSGVGDNTGGSFELAAAFPSVAPLSAPQPSPPAPPPSPAPAP